MARRRPVEEPENHERWLISYADFITLLFAFFVVMYSISSVNEGKYRVLSNSLAAGFKGPPRSLDPIQVGSLVRQRTLYDPMTTQRMKPSSRPLNVPAPPIDKDLKPIPLPKEKGQVKAELTAVEIEARRKREALRKIHDDLQTSGKELLDKELIRVTQTEDWIEIELNQNTLFAGASANLRGQAGEVLDEIAVMLKKYENGIHVEGHADSRPIRTRAFPSNWELSAARAASVVSYFVSRGLDAQRMAAVGYGQFRPIADNETAAGRRRNRRVVIVVHSDAREAGDLVQQPRAVGQ